MVDLLLKQLQILLAGPQPQAQAQHFTTKVISKKH